MLPALPDQLQPWAMATLLAGMIAVLVIKHFGTDIVLMGVLTACVLLGLIEPAEAVGGFANQGLATVGLLYIVAAGMKETGATTMLVSRLLGRPKSLLETQARLTLPVAGVSAFVNNTPIVAMFLPTLAGVARRGGFPASKLFMPLSFASILGGVCTMIGTSTNIVVADLVNSGAFLHNGAAVSMGMFSLTPIGLPIAVLGLGYMLLLASRLLPDRDEGRATDPGQQRQYMVAMRVPEGSALAGRSIEQAGLRNLPGLFLARVDRGETSIVAVDPDERLRADDVLSFVGNLESVVDLQRTRGLEPITDEQEAIGNRSNLTVTEVVVSASSALIGRSIRDCGIRTRYNAVVVAVHRRGHRLAGKIGSIVLQAGDTLLLETDKDFIARHGESRDFYLATERAESAAPRHERAWIALVILGLLVGAITTGAMTPLAAALTAAGLTIITRCCTGPQARANVDWQVLVTIGAAFGIGRAMQQTGTAETLAHAIVGAAEPWGPVAILGVIYLITVLFSATMTNIAAAVLMFPIAMGVASEAGLDPMPFAVVIAIAASCEFSTPIGYQTNLMVMGPGGYRWRDYTRFGGPLTILVGIACVLLTPLVYPLR
jgi:di/tricarboxylate transporter